MEKEKIKVSVYVDCIVGRNLSILENGKIVNKYSGEGIIVRSVSDINIDSFVIYKISDHNLYIINKIDKAPDKKCDILSKKTKVYVINKDGLDCNFRNFFCRTINEPEYYDSILKDIKNYFKI